MASPRVLLSGDYWHADFKNLIASLFIPATLLPLESLQDCDMGRFSLIVIAQSRSRQFDQSVIDDLVAREPLTPVVMLLGSWCEGERRSDQPVQGVKHVYWHQWQGQFTNFCQQMSDSGISLWHAPVTENAADKIVHRVADEPSIQSIDGVVVGISTSAKETFETLSHGITAIGGKSKWVERTSWINMSASVEIICIDADSVDETLTRRVRWMQNQAAHVPIVALLNFPRRQEIEALNQLGVASVISKPFDLSELKTALIAAIGGGAPSKQMMKGPSFSNSRRPTRKR